jgi:hypothetical protein
MAKRNWAKKMRKYVLLLQLDRLSNIAGDRWMRIGTDRRDRRK